MAQCPACDTEIDVDESSCPECGSNLVVAGIAPVTLDSAPDGPEDPAGWPQEDDEEQAKPFH